MGVNGYTCGINVRQWVLLGGAESCLASHIVSFVRVHVMQKGTPAWYDGGAAGVLSVDLQQPSFYCSAQSFCIFVIWLGGMDKRAAVLGCNLATFQALTVPGSS